MDYQQGFVVGVSRRGRPIEGSCDHNFVVDHGELVVDILEMCFSACVLMDVQAHKARTKAALTDWIG